MPQGLLTVFAALVLCILTGCTGQSRQTSTDPDWPAHSASLLQLQTWSVQGKISLRSEQRSETANLAWSQSKNISELNLSGPLGMSATTISSDGSSIDVISGDEHQHFDISTPDAIRRETGWNLPLQALLYWIKGIPDPGLDIQALEVNAGLLTHLDQSGWTITYQNYSQFGRYTLPTKLQLEASDTRIRVIIRRWTVEAG